MNFIYEREVVPGLRHEPVKEGKNSLLLILGTIIGNVRTHHLSSYLSEGYTVSLAI